MGDRTTRSERAAATREALLVTAERLFAEHGLADVSGRQISEAAGQGNNTAVSYHFGSKTDLVRAVIARHEDDMERRRQERLSAMGPHPTTRDWVECIVLPITDHLDSLQGPTWIARFGAQVMTDPLLRPIVEDEALRAPSLQRATAELDRCLEHLPPEVRDERKDMMRQLLVLAPATREARLAAGTGVHRPDWRGAGIGLIDAISALLEAPVTPTD